MSGMAREKIGIRICGEVIPNKQRPQSARNSSEQLEDAILSMSLSLSENDEEDDGEPKPSDFEIYFWRIKNFPLELAGIPEFQCKPFMVGGIEWYLFIAPHECDAEIYISLFLGVTNHDKLLPGWSYSAQFTLAVLNINHEHTRFADYFHRFWKREHSWGNNKLIKLSELSDGFLNAENLSVRVQVQVIREKIGRPFRSLDCNYRRELADEYLADLKKIHKQYVEEKRSKLGNLLCNIDLWSSFGNFWFAMDDNTRRCMSRETIDVILRGVVKKFFIEEKVTSPLVMDYLYSSLKELKSHSRSKEVKEMAAPMIYVENDSFVLVDDVLILIEKASIEPFPLKTEKVLENGGKVGCLDEKMEQDSIEWKEQNLKELGRCTLEIFTLTHILEKIEYSYKEAVALKMQEDLIREEEQELTQTDQKAKSVANDKQKKMKKSRESKNSEQRKLKNREEYCNGTISSHKHAL